ITVQKARGGFSMGMKRWGLYLPVLATVGCLVAPSAKADINGTLYFTTFQAQGAGPTSNNVFSVSISYVSGVSLTVGGVVAGGSGLPSTTGLAALAGADGLDFAPGTGNTVLLVGEQKANKVAEVNTGGGIAAEKSAAGQTYGINVDYTKAGVAVGS